MATRTLSQITKQLAKTDAPSEQLLKDQIAAIPGQFQGQKKGLQAQQRKAFQNILGGAKQRGLKFSGIPLAEQAEFTATNFLPALAQLESQSANQQFDLRRALAEINRERGLTAQSLFQTELDRAAQERQAAASRAAQFDFSALRSQFESRIAALQNQLAGGGSSLGFGAPVSSTSTPLVNADAQTLLNSANPTIRKALLANPEFRKLLKPQGDVKRSVDARGNVTLTATPRF